jgi:hypothetical protein
MSLWSLVQENKVAVIVSCHSPIRYGSDDPIYTPEGKWSYECPALA